MSTDVVVIAWSPPFGGGWETRCDTCGLIWTEMTGDENELETIHEQANFAAFLHEDKRPRTTRVSRRRTVAGGGR